MNKLQKLESQLSAIQAQIDEMKKEGDEWPKVGDKVWTIGIGGIPVATTVGRTPMWRYKLATGNCHRTESEASAYRAWLTSPRTQAKRLVEMCDGFKANGAWRIIMDADSKKLFTHASANSFGGLEFNKESQAQSAIDKLGEEVIKLALGVE